MKVGSESIHKRRFQSSLSLSKVEISKVRLRFCVEHQQLQDLSSSHFIGYRCCQARHVPIEAAHKQGKESIEVKDHRAKWQAFPFFRILATYRRTESFFCVQFFRVLRLAQPSQAQRHHLSISQASRSNTH